VRSTISLGRVAGIPVGMHWSALIGMVVLGQLVALMVLPSTAPGLGAGAYWLAGGLAALGLGGSLLTHELAHAIVARRAGLGVRRITLWLLGGVSELVGQPTISTGRGGPHRAGRSADQSGSGRSVRCGHGGHPCSCCSRWSGGHAVVVGLDEHPAGGVQLAAGNTAGRGRVLHGLLWRHTGDRDRATRAATTSGRVLGALLAGTGVLLALHGRLDGLWLLLVGWFLSGSATAERAATIVMGRLAGLRVADVMSAPPVVASGWWTVQAFIDHLLGEPGRRYRQFPVVDVDGRLTGVVSIVDLTRCPPADRRNIPVWQLGRPLADELMLTSDVSLSRCCKARQFRAVVCWHPWWQMVRWSGSLRALTSPAPWRSVRCTVNGVHCETPAAGSLCTSFTVCAPSLTHCSV